MKKTKYKNYGIHSNTYHLLFGDMEQVPLEEAQTYENKIMRTTIDIFTKREEKKIFTKLLKIIYKTIDIDQDKITWNDTAKEYEYKNANQVITFDKLSNHLENKKLKQELFSNKRLGKCHERSLDLVAANNDYRITTGYIISGKYKILHSVVEVDVKDKKIVLDWTQNLYIEKKQYQSLMKFTELSSIEGAQAIEELTIIAENFPFGTKPYLAFREEIMRDIERNSGIFQSNEENKKKR